MIRASAPAKINLSLEVVGRREDGYHLIHSVMQAISIRETIEISKRSQPGICLTVIGADVRADQNNTAYRAASAFFEKTGLGEIGLDIKLIKQVPVGAGLGGGSADAAAVLAALNERANTGLSVEELCEIGALVGADVPFCIMGGTALATGTGTTLHRLSPMPDCFIVIAKPVQSVSTAEAYRLIDDAEILPRGFLMEDVIKSDIKTIAGSLSNDFDSVIKLSGVEDIKRIMRLCCALGCQMTGSGSAVYALFDKKDAATRCYNELLKHYRNVFLCKPDMEGARTE